MLSHQVDRSTSSHAYSPAPPKGVAPSPVPARRRLEDVLEEDNEEDDDIEADTGRLARGRSGRLLRTGSDRLIPTSAVASDNHHRHRHNNSADDALGPWVPSPVPSTGVLGDNRGNGRGNDDGKSVSLPS